MWQSEWNMYGLLLDVIVVGWQSTILIRALGIVTVDCIIAIYAGIEKGIEFCCFCLQNSIGIISL